MAADLVLLTARRALLGAGHAHNGPFEEDSHDGHDHGAEELQELSLAGHDGPESTMDVRIAAVFAIAAAALLCGLPPLFMRAFQSADSVVARVARAFSGGIILALALIHIVPSAMFELAGLVAFPVGGAAVLGGILMMVVLDSSLMAIWAPKAAADHASHSHGDHHAHEHGAKEAAHEAAKDGDGSDDAAPRRDAVAVVLDAAAAAPPSAHTHACTSSLTPQRLLGGGGLTGALNTLRMRVTAYTMELGCIFHSVIIGVGVGVITDDRHLVIVLMVALMVHQGLEGLSLGTVMALSPFTRAKKVAMVTLYAMTTSVGIAIGIGLSSSYDPRGVAARVVQGTLNGVSGGMLIYIALLQLIAEEFSRADLLTRGPLRLGVTGGLLLGAAAMCVLAIWS